METRLSFLDKLRLFYMILFERLSVRYYREDAQGGALIPSWMKDMLSYGFSVIIGSTKTSSRYRRSGSYGKGQKTKLQIYLDNLMWALRYKETNGDYYVYGLDKIGSNPKEYLANTEFRVIRNILNIRVHENVRSTTYCYNYLCLLRDKFVFGQICDSLGVPHPETYGVSSNGRIYWLGLGEDGFKDICAESLPCSIDAFCKERSGCLGVNIFALRVENGVVYINDQRASIEELKSRVESTDYIIQKRVYQHSVLNSIYPHSINTIRLVTIRNSAGEIVVLASILRVGSGGGIIDNAARGGLVIGINMSNGCLLDQGFYKPKYGGYSVERHPDTDIRFAGITIPFYEEATTMAQRFHATLSGINSIGWDIAITDKGPIFIEGNEDWEIEGIQIAHGGQKKRFYELHGHALKVPLRKVR